MAPEATRPADSDAAAAGRGGLDIETELDREPDSWQGKATRVELSLQDAIRMGLENNLGIKVSRLDEQARRRDLVVAEAVFDPFFNLGTTYARNRDPSVSIIDSSNPTGVGLSRANTLSYYGSVTGTHLLGTRYELRVSQAQRDRPTVNPAFTVLNPTVQTALTAALRQPLLKGAWYSVNTAEVRIAENNAALARDQLEVTVIDTVFGIEEAYWDLLFSLRNLVAKEKALSVTTVNLENVEKKRAIGTLAVVDVTTAQSQVAIRRVELEDARLLAENARDRLLGVINYTGEQSLKEAWEAGNRLLPFDNVQVICTSKPESPDIGTTREEALALAFAHRPEYRQADLSVRNQEIQADVARNALLPSLDVFGEWSQLGLDQTFGDSWDGLSTGDYYSWLAGVEFSVPLSNRGPRNTYRNARENVRRVKLAKADLENQIVLEVDRTIRSLASLKRKTAELRERVRLQRALVDAERTKVDAGKSIPYAVSVIENDLVSDFAAYLRAQADLQRARAEFYRSTGTLLLEHRIEVLSE